MTQDSNTPSSDTSPSYGFHLKLKKADFAAVVTQTIEALKTEGFGVLTDIDIRPR